ncbi:cornifelin homolog B-like [Alosa pseudoharengus]|uniref:cornifelin homolog B-like n=1 Tax=Alosa pseudoharengus TaxID=34774 RepID=UPI003F899C74
MAVQHQVTSVTTTYSSGSWSTGLGDCCSDMGTCCCAMWCFPCMQCQTTSQHGWCFCMPVLDPLACMAVTICLRKSIREKHGIEGSLGNDILLSCCCYPCTWCQMSRELKNRS